MNRPPRLPGDPTPRQELERALRVDHAGEYGAMRIYAGQLAVLGSGPSGPAIRHMAAQEQRHLDTFAALLAERRVRPTLLSPFWHMAGYALGAATALLGEKAAMACTVAVEDVIDDHYRRQAERLAADEPALCRTLDEFRADELAHRDTALSNGAEQAPGYDVLSFGVCASTRLATWLSERL